MGTTEKFDLSLEAAELYEAKFAPAMFAEWAPHLVDAAAPAPGSAVLDVACGTGAVTREAADRVGPGGRVAGADLSANMLAVARRLRPDLEWHEADAASLPFPDGAFDAVLCQAGLMFFPDPEAALREMARVAKPDGVVAVQVWDRLDNQPPYRALVDVAARHAGPDAVSMLSAYWVHGDLDALGERFATAGLAVHDARTRVGAVRFGSVDEFVATEIHGTPLGERLDPGVEQRILDDVRPSLEPYADAAGAVAVPIQGHLVTARRARGHEAGAGRQ